VVAPLVRQEVHRLVRNQCSYGRLEPDRVGVILENGREHSAIQSRLVGGASVPLRCQVREWSCVPFLVNVRFFSGGDPAEEGHLRRANDTAIQKAIEVAVEVPRDDVHVVSSDQFGEQLVFQPSKSLNV